MTRHKTGTLGGFPDPPATDSARAEPELRPRDRSRAVHPLIDKFGRWLAAKGWIHVLLITMVAGCLYPDRRGAGRQRPGPVVPDLPPAVAVRARRRPATPARRRGTGALRSGAAGARRRGPGRRHGEPARRREPAAVRRPRALDRIRRHRAGEPRHRPVAQAGLERKP